MNLEDSSGTNALMHKHIMTLMHLDDSMACFTPFPYRKQLARDKV